MLLGVITGIVLPSIFIYIFYMINYSYTTFTIMVEHYHSVGRISSLLSLSLLVNLVVFFVLYWRKFQMAPRGVILATFIWGIAIVYFKL
jgi:uncharacterized membrane protein